MIARKRAKLTQQQLATVIGVQRSVISKYENGIIEPSISQLQKIAKALNVTASYLLGVSDTMDVDWNSLAFDLAINDHLQQDSELKRQKDSITERSSDSSKKALLALESLVLEICHDDRATSGTAHLHELELLPARINTITDFIKANESFLKKNMPGLVPSDNTDK